MRPAIPTIRPFRAGRDPALRRGRARARRRRAGARALGGGRSPRRRRSARPSSGRPRSLIGTAGAQILAGFLALAGVFLLSGGALGAAVRAGGTRLARSARTRRPRSARAPRSLRRVTPPEPVRPRARRARDARRGARRSSRVPFPDFAAEFELDEPDRARTFASCTTSRPSSCRCPSPSS